MFTLLEGQKIVFLNKSKLKRLTEYIEVVQKMFYNTKKSVKSYCIRMKKKLIFVAEQTRTA